jgi:hypothetical protein
LESQSINFVQLLFILSILLQKIVIESWALSVKKNLMQKKYYIYIYIYESKKNKKKEKKYAASGATPELATPPSGCTLTFLIILHVLGSSLSNDVSFFCEKSSLKVATGASFPVLNLSAPLLLRPTINCQF